MSNDEVNPPFRNKLTRLPGHIKNDLDRLVSEGWGSQSCKKMLEAKFNGDPMMLMVSRKTYQNYINWFRSTSATEQILAPQHTTDQEHVSFGVKQLLNTQYQSLEALINTIHAKKSEGYDPKLDDQIAKFQRDQRNILKLILEHGDDLIEKAKDDKKEEHQEFLTAFIVAACEVAYIAKHGTEQIAAFKDELLRQIPHQIQNHKELYEHT